MKTIALAAGVVSLILINAVHVQAGIQETKSFKLSVTLPASSGIQAQPNISSPLPERDITAQSLITEETLRDNKPVVIKTAVVK